MGTDIQNGFPKYAVFAAMLAFVGLPIYIHAPKFYVDTYGISLSAIGVALVAVRLLDFVQDPVLGWLSDRLTARRPFYASLACMVLAAGMFALFAIPPVGPALLWFVFCLAVMFTAFSFLTIVFYAQGVRKVETLGTASHTQLSIWRETGGLIGVCLASILPFIFAMFFSNLAAPMTLYAIAFVGLVVVATVFMRGEWSRERQSVSTAGANILSDKTLRRLLVVAFLNAAPVAVTSSLFLFYVESRLGADQAAAPLLLLFFLSAALAAPFWGRIANRVGAQKALLWGMALSIGTFAFAFGLGTGDVVPFGVVCLLSGAALGADMTLLPALFSRQVSQSAVKGGQAFGLWSFCVKATLAIAAITVLPVLEFSGFSSGTDNSEYSLLVLSILYALVPCVLKALAFILLFFTPLQEV